MLVKVWGLQFRRGKKNISLEFLKDFTSSCGLSHAHHPNVGEISLQVQEVCDIRCGSHLSWADSEEQVCQQTGRSGCSPGGRIESQQTKGSISATRGKIFRSSTRY